MLGCIRDLLILQLLPITLKQNFDVIFGLRGYSPITLYYSPVTILPFKNPLHCT